MHFRFPPRVRTVKGPHGEIIVTRTYTNWRYSVTMRTDGAIHVNQGDWLSKYSAALYDDLTQVHEFGRRDRSGMVRPIHNINLIFAGETIYHIPTYKKAHPLRLDAIEVKASPLSDEQKKKVILDTMKADFDLQGERFEILERACSCVHGADTGAQLLEIAGLIAEGTAAVTLLQAVAAFLLPIEIGILILNASETEKRIAGMQAIPYTLTAWAFGDPIPPYPSSLRANYLDFRVPIGPGKEALPGVEQAWKAASDATVRNLEAEVVKKRRYAPNGMQKKDYQIFWQAVGGLDKKELARRLMDVRAEELYGAEKRSFLALDPEGYPN